MKLEIQTSKQQQAESHRGRWRLETPSKSEVPGEPQGHLRHQSPGGSQTKVGLHAPPDADDGGADEDLGSPRVLLHTKVCQMSQCRSLFPQELQAPERAEDIGIKEWLLQKEVTCIFYFFPRA